MQKVNRENLLLQLESVQAGLSAREIIEQSSCFVFKDGKVMTYNDEISCRQKTSLELTGAVQAVPLLAILRKLTDEELTLTVEGNELVIKGKRRTCGITMEADVLLPVDKVEVPTKWKELHADFAEAVELVQHCASTDESRFSLTCIHLHTDHIEACDNFQVARVNIQLGVKTPVLVKRDALKQITSLAMTQFAETENWTHFKNAHGLTLSCRHYREDYPDMSSILKFKGHPITLPKGLASAADNASIFSADSAEDNLLLVELRPGKMRLRGEGANGWYQEMKKLSYDGPSLSFRISPKLLINITETANDAEISEDRLRVKGAKWQYISCLAAPDAPSSKEEPTTEDEKE